MSNLHKGDPIQNLPVDDSPPSHNEINMINNIFKSNDKNIKNLLTEIKYMIISAALFILFSIPKVDTTIKSLIPYCENNDFFLLIIKAIIFSISLYFIQHIGKVRK